MCNLKLFKTFRVNYYKGNEEKQFLDSPLSPLSQIAYQSTITSIISSNIKHKNKFFHSVLKEIILSPSAVMYCQKNFYFITQIDSKISNLLSSGIIKHIIEKYLDMRFWNIKHSKGKNQKLSLKHLEGAFLLWSFLSFISFSVFILEHCLDNLKKNKEKSIKLAWVKEFPMTIFKP